MGDQQPEQEPTIKEHCIPNINDLPIHELGGGGRPFGIDTSRLRILQSSPFTTKDDANLYLQAFTQLSNTFDVDGVTQNQLRTRLFPYSLLGRALQWFYSLPVATIQNWDKLMKAFLIEHYSPTKTQNPRSRIPTFAQYTSETIAEAHEHFNDYIRAISHYKYPKEDLVQKFYQGLTPASRAIIDTSAGGSIIDLTPTQDFKLYKKVVDNDAWASSGCLFQDQPTRNTQGVLQVERDQLLKKKMDSLMRRLEKMEIKEAQAIDLKVVEARSTYEECGDYGHIRKNCSEEAKLLDYMKKGEWFPPSNYQYGQNRPQFNVSSFIQNIVSLRIQLKEFMEEQGKINKDTITKFKATGKIMENTNSKVTEVGSSTHQVMNMMKMLETKVT
ncbi:uncharacterized protein LOC101772613 [Setaria italica]|uniref:uncharacterized protein LOC101772613 n=1 Tax=Setaria italica TaxID=4555 RepID=UPI000350FB1A|nr:uncharacterized protein LOC101772613 [Setaria italica]